MCKKMKIGKLLCFFSAFCMVFLLTIYSFDSIPVSADNATLTLTLQETVALYGPYIDATFYNSGVEEQVRFNYFGISSDFIGDGSYGSNIPILSTYQISGNNSIAYKNILNTSPFLIYSCRFHNYSFYRGLRLNISFPFTLSNLTNYEGQFGFSIGGSTTNTTSSSHQSLVSFDTSLGVKNLLTCSGFSYSSACFRTAIAAPDSFGQYSSSDIFTFSATVNIDSNAVYFSGSSFDINSVTASWYDAGGIVTSAVTGGYTDLYLLIQCPTLWNYTPPVTTTVSSATSQTTNPYNYNTVPTGYTQQTVDLSNLESGVAAIVQQEQYNGDTLDWIGNNTMITANNLAYIANKLDQIYDLMVQRGEIAVNLVPADPLRVLDTNVHNQIHDSLDSFTTAQIPIDYTNDMQHSFSFVNTMYSKFTSGSLSFFGWLGIFSLSMYVVIWFIFRGRG